MFTKNNSSQFMLFVLIAAWALTSGCATQQTDSAMTQSELTVRGQYLVTTGGCNDCHTPWVVDMNGVPMPDSTRLLSGHPENEPYPVWQPADAARHTFVKSNATNTAWAGPWGVSFTANLTPDRETGLGEWTEEAFLQALRTGKHQGQPNGRDILPPMPWFNYGQLTDADLKAIWAYLRTIKAIKNQDPLPIQPTEATDSTNSRED